MGTTLYRRTGKLIVGETSIDFGPSEALRVTFEVQKVLIAPDPNTATIKVYNLAHRTRSKLAQVYKSKRGRLPILLEAGYVGHHGTIFRGETTRIHSSRESTGWVTEIVAASGREVARKRINRAFGQDTEVASMLESLLQDTVAGTVQGAREALDAIRAGKIVAAGKALVKGIVLSGDPMKVWDQVSSSYEFDAVIDDDQIVLLQRAGARSNPAVVLRHDTGLLGVPEPTQDDARPGLLLASGRSLLNPRIVIGGRIRLESESLSGDFRAEQITHAGDTHGDEWSTSFEGREL